MSYGTVAPSQCPTECQGQEENLFQSVLNIRISHGVTMAACWIVIYPLGIVFARYFKGWSRWMEVHALLQKLGTTGAIGLVLANVITRSSADTYSFHSMCGYVIVAGLIAQICMGTAHKARLSTFWVDVPTFFKALAPTHATLGSCLLMLAPFQMVSGIRNYWGERTAWEYIYYVLIVIWAVVFTYFEVRKYKEDKLSKSQDRPNPFITDESYENLKIMTWESVVTGCMHDAEWIVIRGICYDVRTWRAAHPGGQGRLTQMFGHDATEMFINGPHAHSSTAWKKMSSLAVGRLCPNEINTAKSEPNAFVFQLLTVTQVESAGNFRRITCATPSSMCFAKPGICMPPAKASSAQSPSTSAAPTEHKVGITAIVNVVTTGATDLAARLRTGVERRSTTDTEKKTYIFPGQHLVLKATTGDELAVRQLERPYTPFHSDFLKSDAPPPLARALSSLPKGPLQTIDFVVKVYKYGKMSKFIDTLKPGTQVSVRGPLGMPVLNPHSADGRWKTLFLLAGGSGITPMLQFLHYHLDYEEDNPNKDPSKWPVIHLVWCSHEGNNLLTAKLAELEANSRGRLRITTPGVVETLSTRPALERAVSGQSQIQLTVPYESAKLTLRVLETAYEQTFDLVCPPLVPTTPSRPGSPKSPLTTPLLSRSSSSSSLDGSNPPSTPPSLASAFTGSSSAQLTTSSRKWERLFGLDSTKVMVCGPPGFVEAAGEFSRTVLGPELAKSALHFF